MVATTGFSQLVSRAQVVQGVKAPLEAMAVRSGSGLKVVTLFQRHDLNLPDGEVTWRVELDSESLKLGRQPIPVSVLVDGEAVSSISLNAVIKRFVEVPVVRRTIKRGVRITADDIQWHKIELVRAIDGLVKDEMDVIGMVAVRTIREKTPLRTKWFRLPLAVDRGERVRVRVAQKGLVINTVGIALEKGRVGDLIELRNPQSHVRYEARISAPGQALVQTW